MPRDPAYHSLPKHLSHNTSTHEKHHQQSLMEQLGNAAPLHSGALPMAGPTPEGQKIRILANPSEDLATYVIAGEDHTLGNAVRYLLSRDPRIAVAGYSIPHPSEHKIHLRIQTYKQGTVQLPQSDNDSSAPATTSQVLVENCQHLSNMCDTLMDTLDAAEIVYQERQQAAAKA